MTNVVTNMIQLQICLLSGNELYGPRLVTGRPRRHRRPHRKLTYESFKLIRTFGRSEEVLSGDRQVDDGPPMIFRHLESPDNNMKSRYVNVNLPWNPKLTSKALVPTRTSRRRSKSSVRSTARSTPTARCPSSTPSARPPTSARTSHPCGTVLVMRGIRDVYTVTPCVLIISPRSRKDTRDPSGSLSRSSTSAITGLSMYGSGPGIQFVFHIMLRTGT